MFNQKRKSFFSYPAKMFHDDVTISFESYEPLLEELFLESYDARETEMDKLEFSLK